MFFTSYSTELFYFIYLFFSLIIYVLFIYLKKKKNPTISGCLVVPWPQFENPWGTFLFYKVFTLFYKVFVLKDRWLINKYYMNKYVNITLFFTSSHFHCVASKLERACITLWALWLVHWRLTSGFCRLHCSVVDYNWSVFVFSRRVACLAFDFDGVSLPLLQ